MTDSPQELTGAAQQMVETLNVLSWFRRHQGGTFMQASRDLGIPVAQIKHELAQLSMCGLPGYLPGSLVEISADKTTARVDFTTGLDGPLSLTASEASVLLLNLEAMRSTLPVDRQAIVNQVSAKLRAVLDSRLAGVAPNRSAEDPQGAPAAALTSPTGPEPDVPCREQAIQSVPAHRGNLLQQLHEAVKQRQLLTATYHSLASDTLATREIHPDHVAVIDGDAYMWGREPGREQRTYAVSRLRDISLSIPGTADADIQTPSVDADDPFGFSDSHQWAELRLTPRMLWMLEYFPMWLVEGSDSDVSIPDTGEWLERLCIAYAHDITVLAPAELVERVRRRACAGLQAYSN